MINYNNYLRDIGIVEGVIKNRIDEIVKYYNKLHNEDELKDIFISEYIDEEGNRIYTSLWLFYDKIICEAKNFINETDFDSSSYEMNKIVYWNMKSKDFIQDEIKDSDRLLLHVIFNENNVSGDFKASKINCKYLLNLLEKYFVYKAKDISY